MATRAPRAQCGLHRDAIGPLPLPVRLIYGGGCADPLSAGLCKTESSALIIPEASIHKPRYPNPLLSHLLLPSNATQTLAGRDGCHNFMGGGRVSERTTVEFFAVSKLAFVKLYIQYIDLFEVFYHHLYAPDTVFRFRRVCSHYLVNGLRAPRKRL